MVGLSSVIHTTILFLYALLLIRCILPGVRAGMFVKDAKIRCPQLVIVPYDFGAYETVSTNL